MRSLAAVAALLVLGGCAIMRAPEPGAPGVADPEAWRERQQDLAGFDHWSLQGRAATGKVLGWSGNLSWRQRGESFDVRLSGPLGAGGFRARGEPGLVRIYTEDETYYTNDPEALVEEIVGWRFPLTGLRYWAIGLPAPGMPGRVAVDGDGLLTDLWQAGWRLAYTDYREAGGLTLPRRIVLDNGDNTIKLVIDRWFDLER
ncbi:outer membrane lipoprotein LolB [Salinisphaera sp. PC39]|uniref:lipoprotein insertase outer membrane protein LolB n=1 Tax=Salinisphaera sp. PC39 TaxID=1304156 RepID=UPI0033411913